MRESEFQKNFISKVKVIFPDCTVLKNDARYLQGVPDWSVFYKDKYALLEIKAAKNAHHQPNQDYYISKCNDNGGFARFVYPENEVNVLTEMRLYFNNIPLNN